jgi:hypothetical protein
VLLTDPAGVQTAYEHDADGRTIRQVVDAAAGGFAQVTEHVSV